MIKPTTYEPFVWEVIQKLILSDNEDDHSIVCELITKKNGLEILVSLFPLIRSNEVGWDAWDKVLQRYKELKLLNPQISSLTKLYLTECEKQGNRSEIS